MHWFNTRWHAQIKTERRHGSWTSGHLQSRKRCCLYHSGKASICTQQKSTYRGIKISPAYPYLGEQVVNRRRIRVNNRQSVADAPTGGGPTGIRLAAKEWGIDTFELVFN